MRNMVKFGFIAVALLLVSCGDDFPNAPEMKYCKFENSGSGKTDCKSVHIFSEKDCAAVDGEIVETCKEEN